MAAQLLQFLLLTWAAFAQVDTSTSIRGLVTDPTGAAVPAASVSIRNVETGETRSTNTDGSGFYAFPSVVPGTYNVLVEHPGFKRAEVRGRVAQVTQSAQVDVVLQIGDTTESVTVSAEGAELISTTTAEVAGTVVQSLVENLPLNGRNFFDLTAVLPHVSPQNLAGNLSFGSIAFNRAIGTGPESPIFRQSGIFAAGNRDSATNVAVDGVNVQISVYGQTTPQQPPSAIHEVKVHVSSMNAEFGNGAAAVNVITKGGSNEFHGEVYEFFRNDKTDANYFFANLAGRGKPPYRQNQFGGALGGPILHNKLFFFTAYEGFRVRLSTEANQSVPPDELRNGDFSGYRPPGPGGTFLATPVIFNPYRYDSRTGLREPFPGNRIPMGTTNLCSPKPTCIDPVTLKFLQNHVPRPNAVLNGIPVLAGVTKNTLNQDMGILRIDWSKSNDSRIYGRYTNSEAPSASRGPQFLQGETNDGATQNAVIHWTRVLSPSTVSDLFLGYGRMKWFLGRPVDVPDVAAEIGLKNTRQIGGGPIFGGTGFNLNQSQQTLLDATENLYQIGEDFSHVRGRHTFKFGGQVFNRRLYYPRDPNNKGNFSFTPRYTAACPAGNQACIAARNAAGLPAGGNAFADYLLGTASSVLFQINSAPYHGHRTYFGLYAQDSWRATARLTLNYGLRYEYWTPWLLPRNTIFTYNEITGEIRYSLKNPLDYLDPGTDGGRKAPRNEDIPRAGYTAGQWNFGPRFGLAYSVTPRTVFRMAYGIYYDANVNVNQFSDLQGGIAPFFLRHEVIASAGEQIPSIQVDGSFPVPGPTDLPYPNANPPFSFRVTKPHYPASSIQEWSASIQQRLGNDWAAEISYTGTHAIHLQQFIDVNSADLPQGPLASLPLQQRRPHPEWGVIGTWAPIGFGRYNGGSVSIKNNRWHGLTLLSSFTYAKNLVSSILGTSDHGNTNHRAPYIWFGPARLTPRLRFVNAYSYDLPVGRGKYWGGWTFSGIVDLTTGSPNRVTTNDLTGTGLSGSAHPDRICDARKVPGGRSYLQWFNTGCFVQPAFGTWGNSPFGVYEDPGIANWNVAISKATPIRAPFETGQVEFRVDLFNVLNHTQWGGAAAVTVQSGNVNAGRINSTRPPRQVQFSLRYLF